MTHPPSPTSRRFSRAGLLLTTTVLLLLPALFLHQATVRGAQSGDDDRPTFALLKDINSATADSRFANVFRVGEGAYFLQRASPFWELWYADENAARMVHQFEHGDPYDTPQIEALGDGRAVLSYQPPGGATYSYWLSDGTPENTVFWFELELPLFESYLGVANNTILFHWQAPGDTTVGRELWGIQPDQSTPELLADLTPGPNSTYPSPTQLATVEGALLLAMYDAAGSEILLLTDGTAAGTRTVMDGESPLSSQYNLLATDPAHFWLVYTRPEVGADGYHLQTVKRVDTAGGVMTLPPLTALDTLNDMSSALRADGRWVDGLSYFWGRHRNTEYYALDDVERIWESDGTGAGTRPLIDLWEIQAWEVVDGTLHVLGREYRDAPRTWWAVNLADGSRSTVLQLDKARFPDYEEPIGLFIVDETGVMMVAGYEKELAAWNRNGQEIATLAGARVLCRHLPYHQPGAAFYLFVGMVESGYGCEPAAFNGSSFVALADVTTEPTQDASPDIWAEFGGRAYFLAQDHEHGLGVWARDGTEEGTVLVHALEQDGQAWEWGGFIPAGHTLFFHLQAYVNGVGHQKALWALHGEKDELLLQTSASLEPLAFSEPLEFGATTTQFYFFNLGHLWTSDGTPAGTLPVQRPDGGVLESSATRIHLDGDTLYLPLEDGIWAVTGATARRVETAPATFLETNLFASAPDSTLLHFLATAPGSAGDETIGIWRLDVATGAMTLVKDLGVTPSVGAYTYNNLISDPFRAGDLFFFNGASNHGNRAYFLDSGSGVRPAAPELGPEAIWIEKSWQVGGSTCFQLRGDKVWCWDPETDGFSLATDRARFVDMANGMLLALQWNDDSTVSLQQIQENGLGDELWRGIMDVTEVQELMPLEDGRALVAGTTLVVTDGTPAGTARIADGVARRLTTPWQGGFFYAPGYSFDYMTPELTEGWFVGPGETVPQAVVWLEGMGLGHDATPAGEGLIFPARVPGVGIEPVVLLPRASLPAPTATPAATHTSTPTPTATSTLTPTPAPTATATPTTVPPTATTVPADPGVGGNQGPGDGQLYLPMLVGGR